MFLSALLTSLSHKYNQIEAHGFVFAFFPWEIKWKRGFVLIKKGENLQDFDEMTDDSGVTSAFLFTNFAILLKAKAIVRQFLALFLHNDVERFKAEYQLAHHK